MGAGISALTPGARITQNDQETRDGLRQLQYYCISTKVRPKNNRRPTDCKLRNVLPISPHEVEGEAPRQATYRPSQPVRVILLIRPVWACRPGVIRPSSGRRPGKTGPSAATATSLGPAPSSAGGPSSRSGVSAVLPMMNCGLRWGWRFEQREGCVRRACVRVCVRHGQGKWRESERRARDGCEMGASKMVGRGVNAKVTA